MSATDALAPTPRTPTRACSICTDPHRPLIDRALAQGHPQTWVASKYGLSPKSVGRHCRKHLPHALRASRKAQDIAAADSLLAKVEALVMRGLTEFAEGDHSPKLKLLWQDRVQRALELLGRVGGELRNDSLTVVLGIPVERAKSRLEVLERAEAIPEREAALQAAQFVVGWLNAHPEDCGEFAAAGIATAVPALALPEPESTNGDGSHG